MMFQYEANPLRAGERRTRARAISTILFLWLGHIFGPLPSVLDFSPFASSIQFSMISFSHLITSPRFASFRFRRGLSTAAR